MTRALCLFAALAACTPAGTASPRPHLPLLTTGETSHWIRTGHYDEAVQLCHDFARVYDGVTCDELGRTAEDRPIVAVRVERRPGAPYIYVQAGVHAGEIEGKDAGFWFLRDLLDGKIAAGATDAVNVVFVPCINPDGHERFSPNNRPNQRGPEEMGFRTNGERLNVNRDFMKADTPEVQAVLGVMRARDPLVFVDLHATDGAKFEHDIAIDLAPVASRTDHLDAAAHALSEALVARMTALGHLPIGEFYPAFVEDDDPASGFALGEAPPRFSQVYAGIRGRLGILVETHSWRTYAERAKASYHTLQALFELAAKQAPAWSAASAAARAADQSLGGSQLPLVFDTSPHTRELAFRGYHYERKPSEISGGTWVVYDETKPEIWHVPLRDEVIPKVTVAVPKAGYAIEGGFAALVAPILDRHGIAYRRLATQPRVDALAYRATKVTYAPPFEGHTRATLEGTWTPETRTLDRGAIFVPIAQPLGRLVVHLLDPAGPDSLAQWGFFNAAFERKEYMESYVAEEAARAMLAKDPALKAAFDAAVAADADLAKSPAKRLEFFYKRHPAWDERLNLLPVYKLDRAP